MTATIKEQDEKLTSNHLERLMTMEPGLFEARVAALRAEAQRKRASLPIKMLAWLAVALSLLSLASTHSVGSPTFIVPAAIFSICGAVLSFGAWCFHANCRASAAALCRLRASAS